MRFASGEARKASSIRCEVGGDPAQRVGVDRDVGLERLLEQPQDVDRVLGEGGLVDEVEPPVLQAVAGAGRVLAEGEDGAELLAEARARLDVARLERGEEDAGEVAHVLGVGEIVLHEPLDRALAVGGLVAEEGGDLDLGVEGQLLRGASVQEVQVHPRRPEEGLRLGEDAVLLGGEDAGPHQVLAGLGVVEVLADPEQRLQVAQAALALLDVGLEQVARAALAGVALGALRELQLDELRPGLLEELAPEPRAQPLGQPLVAPEVAVLEQAGADGHVRPRQAQAVVDGPDRLADLEAQVPEAVEHALDQALPPGGLLVGGDEEEVDVGEGRHLRPAVAADRQHRDPLRAAWGWAAGCSHAAARSRVRPTMRSTSQA